MACEEIRVHHVDVASLAVRQRITDLVQHVLIHDLVIKLSRSADVEGKSVDFAADFTLGGGVALVFGATRLEFRDVVAVVELVRHVAEEIAEWDVGLPGTSSVDHGIRVEVQGLVPQLLQGLV